MHLPYSFIHEVLGVGLIVQGVNTSLLSERLRPIDLRIPYEILGREDSTSYIISL